MTIYRIAILLLTVSFWTLQATEDHVQLLPQQTIALLRTLYQADLTSEPHNKPKKALTSAEDWVQDTVSPNVRKAEPEITTIQKPGLLQFIQYEYPDISIRQLPEMIMIQTTWDGKTGLDMLLRKLLNYQIDPKAVFVPIQEFDSLKLFQFGCPFVNEGTNTTSFLALVDGKNVAFFVMKRRNLMQSRLFGFELGTNLRWFLQTSARSKIAGEPVRRKLQSANIQLFQRLYQAGLTGEPHAKPTSALDSAEYWIREIVSLSLLKAKPEITTVKGPKSLQFVQHKYPDITIRQVPELIMIQTTWDGKMKLDMLLQKLLNYQLDPNLSEETFDFVQSMDDLKLYEWGVPFYDGTYNTSIAAIVDGSKVAFCIPRLKSSTGGASFSFKLGGNLNWFEHPEMYFAMEKAAMMEPEK